MLFNLFKRRYSLLSALLTIYLAVAIIGFLIINNIYSQVLEKGWMNDIVQSKKMLTADLSQMIQQDLISGKYPEVASKALHLLEERDISELEIVTNDGYTVFSQKKAANVSEDNLLKISLGIKSSEFEPQSNHLPDIGQIKAVYRLDEYRKNISEKRGIVFALFAMVLFLSAFLLSFFSLRVTRPLKKLGEVTTRGALEDVIHFKSESRIIEINELEESARHFANQILDYQKVSVRRTREDAIAQLASQVSHDIRSPLAALEMILPSASELPEDKRLIIRNAINRIRDIANTLLRSSKNIGEKGGADEESTEIRNVLPGLDLKLEVHYLSPLIDSIVSEKRLQYRDRLNVAIDYNHSRDSYCLFANIEQNEFKRVISNLVNNAVEAMDRDQGKVTISLMEGKQGQIQLEFKDNGKGIPKSIIPKLMNKGESYGKAGGNGLGLFHAKETIQAFGGSIVISSETADGHHGTSILVTLPQCDVPSWFVPKIKLTTDQMVVVFDDDQTIHQIWQDRFENKLEHFSSSSAFRKFYGQNFADLDAALFLVDYEFIGQNQTGLDMIEELGIQAQSILVTSRYEEPFVRERCKRLGVKLIPKPMSGFVPIEIA